MTKSSTILCDEVTCLLEAADTKSISNFESDLLVLGFNRVEVTKIKRFALQYVRGEIDSREFRRRLGWVLI